MSVVVTAAYCWRLAAETEAQAARITDHHLKSIHLRIAHHWSVLARSYEFADCAERFLLDAKTTRETALEPKREILLAPQLVGQIDLRDEQHRNLIISNGTAFPLGRFGNLLEAGGAPSPLT